mmetsp:Transcript_14606/g.36514  ORF Transcript_14606/g.36514 Transcript_14606/m.36514 type:complete len:92 (-) Transcript_14606:18-293(-)
MRTWGGALGLAGAQLDPGERLRSRMRCVQIVKACAIDQISYGSDPRRVYLKLKLHDLRCRGHVIVQRKMFSIFLQVPLDLILHTSYESCMG